MWFDAVKIVLISVTFVNLGEPGMIFAWYQKLINPLPNYLFNPLGGCVKCFTGQVSFWFYLIKYFNSYNFIDHLFFVSLSIILSLIINKIWQHCEK